MCRSPAFQYNSGSFLFLLSGRRSLGRRSGRPRLALAPTTTAAASHITHAIRWAACRLRAAGGAAAHQWVVHLKQSLQRELVCGSGAAACAAQTTSPASRPVQPSPSPSSASARGQAVDSGRGCPAGRAGGVKRLTASSPTSHPPHPASMRSRASSDLIAGKAARRRRQRGRSGRRSRSRGEATRRES